MKEKNKGKDRYLWMDVARGLCILLVVFFHSNQLFADRVATFFSEWVFMLSLVRMPLLVFLSGLLVSYSFDKGVYRYVRGKLDNIIYPYIIWNPIIGIFIPYMLFNAEFSSVFQIIRTLILPAEHLWFLASLAVYYAVYPFVRKWPGYILIPLAFLISFYNPITISAVQMMGYLFVFFVLGAILGKNISILSNLIKSYSILLLFLFLALVYVYINPIDSTKYIGYRGANIVLALILIHPALFIANLCTKTLLLYPLGWVGRFSIVIYITHFPIIKIIHEYVYLGISGELYVIAGFCATMFLCILITIACTKMALVRKMFSYDPSRLA